MLLGLGPWKMVNNDIAMNIVEVEKWWVNIVSNRHYDDLCGDAEHTYYFVLSLG